MLFMYTVDHSGGITVIDSLLRNITDLSGQR